MLMDRVRQENLSRFGLRFGQGGVHLARSMMLEDLRQLFQHVPDAQATREDFARAILVDNCLGKRSSKTRQLSLRHLIGLYTLNPRVPIFRGLHFFWESTLRVLDQTGTESQLRNQLSMIHKVIQTNLETPLGHVIPADYLYFDAADKLLQARVLTTTWATGSLSRNRIWTTAWTGPRTRSRRPSAYKNGWN